MQGRWWLLVTSTQLFMVIVWLQPHAINAQSLSIRAALRLPVDAGVAALGNYNVSHTGDNVALFWQNPAYVATGAGTQVSLSFLDYYADVRAIGSAIRFSLNTHHMGIGVRYLSYGKLQGYDERGVSQGTFVASTQLIQLTYGRQLGPFAWGISLLPAQIAVETAYTFGLFTELGATFTHPRKWFRAGLAIKHITLLNVSQRTQEESHVPPLDIWLGMTLQPPGMPFRFSLNLYGLTQRTYYEDTSSPVRVQHNISFLAKALSKCNLGAEVLLGKRLRLQSAFTVKRWQQLRTDDQHGLAGFAFGASMHIAKFILRGTHSFHEVRGGHTHIGIQFDLNAFRRKKEITIE